MRVSKFVSKLFVSSSLRGGSAGSEVHSEALQYSIDRIKENPTANRCFNIIIDSASAINYKIVNPEQKIASGTKLTPKTILETVNRRANSDMDASFFWRSIIADLLADGNAFILVSEGKHYYMPAVDMAIVRGDSPNKLVSHYTFNGNQKFRPDQIIHIKDNTTNSILRGESRLVSLTDIIDLHKKMKTFQKNFFKNNAMPGVVLTSPNTMTPKLKERKLTEWKQDFNPTSGARNPAFLDGGIEVKNLNTSTFREMDFEESVKGLERDIARSMGVPPILLEGGNNANIAPNLRLFYIQTVMPICEKIADALALHYGYEILPDHVGVPALQPDLRELGNYLSGLVNAGVMKPNEARESVGLPPDEDPSSDNLRIPANIAGSASNPNEGGRPQEPKEGE